MLSQGLELFGRLSIAHLIAIQIYDTDAHPVLHFAFAQIMQERPPLIELRQILGDVFGKKNVPDVSTGHHSLCHIETGPSQIGVTIHIDHSADWTTVHSHAQLQPRVLLERATDFDRALRGRFRTGVKDQRHPVPSWNFN